MKSSSSHPIAGAGIDQSKGQTASTLVLIAVLTSSEATSNRIDVIAAWMNVIDLLGLNVLPEQWGPSIHALQAENLVYASMTSIAPIGDLLLAYEVPADYAHAAEMAWLEN